MALLRGWMDYFPFPETWTSELQRRGAKPGPGPMRKNVVCQECEGRGKTRSGWMCSTCKGQGVYDFDTYTSEPVASQETPMCELLRRYVNCPSCGGWGRVSAFAEQRPSRDYPLCEECEGTGKVAALFTGIVRADVEGREEEPRVGDRRLDGMADQHRRRDQHPAYRELAVAMRELHARDRAAHLALCLAYVLEWESPTSLLAPMRLALARGLAFLDGRLPEKLSPPGEVFAAEVAREASMARAKGNGADARARAKRDEEIRRLHAEGKLSLGEIGVRFSLDKSQVSRIVRRPA